MIKGLITMGSAGLLAWSMPLRAEDGRDLAGAGTRGGFAIDAEAFDYNYRERVDGGKVVFDDGTFAGIGVIYVETLGPRLFARARLAIAFGKVDYRSDDGSGLSGVNQDSGQLELHLGYDIPVGRRMTVSPFVGLGSRVLNDHSGGLTSTDDLAGYDREISYGYIPLGLTLSVPMRSGAQLELSAQHNWLVHGEARSNFSKLSDQLPDVKLGLDHGRGSELAAMVDLPLGRHALAIGPYWRHWSVGASDSVTLSDPADPTDMVELFEPDNTTSELGVRVRFAF